MFRVSVAAVRTALAAVVMAVATAVLGTYVVILLRVHPRTRQVTPVMRFWARLFLYVTWTRTEIHGCDKLDPAGSYVFTGNHISNLDIPVMIGRLPVSVRFLAKKELFKVPILGPAMRAIHIVETDRQARTAAHRAINRQVAQVVVAGLSLVIYPEGTRSRDAELMPFKKGAFRIAIDNSLPVVPVTISGTERGWKPGGKLVFGGPATLVIGDPIETSGLGGDDIGELRNRVRDIVAETYAELRAGRT